ncbi:MAG: hypothetical protein A2Y03_06090 [Omnitrophica WOR_2 bacterium GWF2_38_59]|nr:MAG: hypothetical protein A2Y06_08210 [Omnitrophica WOR_2 bacterium GWA2_37_7]OGX22219.1 MAG: hypothetical protein A2Y03_06090 [Omnitrophica WOR_2 bacterium GWF2_38_59]OGX46808.1 MAG: hypothetical protein A2243_05585 [Omnitrophica WOR_2 bacterium RIFOXYA2_FULL_38_17]OGX58796.1 MAG: hypothetical protein A2447_06005 [Omnitrophica WOR_2 bacterium RIFOXYC2_FULL_38_12]OGX59649.1 MAG: hypothetical protein A2306_05625 [Omnitrophica WOR_2 bacterium RIFOXYB2_FULL_38_16]HBG61492.1 hypothetical protei
MQVVDLQISKKEEEANRTDMVGDTLRSQVLDYSKDFKTSWVNLGRHLYAIWQDKLFYGWGFEKFEHYTEEELGLKKQLCQKLLKTYLFVEQNEPQYLAVDFKDSREAVNVPNYDAVDVLRLARSKRELNKADYAKLKAEVFDKGKDASVVRKELTAIMKERKEVDPEEERDNRNEAAIKRLLGALGVFMKDMEVLKLAPKDIIKEADQLIKKLKEQI